MSRCEIGSRVQVGVNGGDGGRKRWICARTRPTKGRICLVQFDKKKWRRREITRRDLVCSMKCEGIEFRIRLFS